MSLAERVQDFRLSRKQFLDAKMPPQGEEICLGGILARPMYEIVATYEAVCFPKLKYSSRPEKEVGKVTYLY